MINSGTFEYYKKLSERLKTRNEVAVIILDNSSENTSYRIEYKTGSEGICLQMKDQNGKDIHTDGFLVDDNVFSWVSNEIESYLAE